MKYYFAATLLTAFTMLASNYAGEPAPIWGLAAVYFSAYSYIKA